MLIPRFSLRFMLFTMTVFGVFFFVVTLSIQGRQWATALTAAIGGLILSMVVQASTFGIAWGFTTMVGMFRGGESARSPFASSSPPPQVLEPLVPEE